MPLRVTVESYRGLSRADWTLEPGVSLLVGPNGSGKTTLLEVPALLADAISKGTRVAVDDHGGPGALLNLRVASADRADIAAFVDECSWRVTMRPRSGDVDIAHRILIGPKQVVLVPRMDEVIREVPRPVHELRLAEPSDELVSPDIRLVVEKAQEALAPLQTALGGYLLHGGYFVRALRLNGSRVSSDVRLDRDGTNAFSVLRNWRDARATRPRWDFVVAGLKEAFPESFEELEFESAGQTVAARLYAPRLKDSIGVYFAPDGLITGLLHLTAVASTPDGGAIAIDEFENSLHPYAIRALLEHIRTWSSQHKISITLATHSPVLIDQFKTEPERILVMDPGAEVVPVPISKMRDPEWLSHFSLGDLYASGDFGAQAPH